MELKGERPVLGLFVFVSLALAIIAWPAQAATYDQQWGLENKGQRVCGFDGTGCVTGKAGADIKAKAAWLRASDCSKVVVAVLDSGVDLTHPDLKPNLLPGKNFVANPSTNNPQDDNLHGTHVAGIIGAAGTPAAGVVGVCKKAKILPVKVGDSEGYLTDSDVLEGIQYAVAQGAKVVNASFGGGPANSMVKKAIGDAPNTLFVIAAGNGDFMGRPVDIDKKPVYPASYDLANIVVVAATDGQDRIGSFSNYGKKRVQLAAPGVNIVSTMPMVATADMRAYRIPVRQGALDGTSMATPFVAGAAALLWSTNPAQRTADVKAKLTQTVDRLSALSAKTTSGGRLNLARLVGAVR